MEDKIKSILPGNFGIVLDGWSENSTHYFGLYAIFPNHSPVVLSFSPPFDETNFETTNIIFFVLDCIAIYGKTRDNLLFLVADNAPENPKIARELGIGFIGCYFHRFNLVVEDYLSEFSNDFDKTRQIMIKASSLKIAGTLRQHTELRPIINNQTRWSSKYEMLKRYFKLEEHFSKLGSEILILLPDSDAKARLTTLFTKLEKKFESVTKALQSEKLNLHQGYLLFDRIMKDFPETVKYWKEQNRKPARLIRNDSFESAVIKVLVGKWKDLSEIEKLCLSNLKEPEVIQREEAETSIDYAED